MTVGGSGRRRTLAAFALAAAGATLGACRGGQEAAPGAAATTAAAAPVVEIRRTAHGIAHITAPDYASLAYGVAYAHAEDNVCQTADHLVTTRGERSQWFGPEGRGLLGLRLFPNAVIDVFVRAHMDDAGLERAAAELGDEAHALARGYVAGYNRFLADHEADLPAPCAGQPWVRPMTLADYRRLQELTMVLASSAYFADARVGAAPPAAGEPAAAVPPSPAEGALASLAVASSGLGSNAWAFGAEVTGNGSGLLLGNPHFPWAGVNRFWEMHLTIPGRLDVMGASIGHAAVVQIGFNHDVAWSHTVSTGQRFTLYELELAPDDPTAYIVDGERLPMDKETITYPAADGKGGIAERTATVWNTRFGPVVELPDAGLTWSGAHAYAFKDAVAGDLRAMEIWIGFNRAESVEAMLPVLERGGVPWVNTVAADRNGSVLYADVSVVPDVGAAKLESCRPSPPAAALFAAADITVLDGSRSECDWARDPQSPVPGWLPMQRMPVAVRRDWVQNSNDSFWLSNPDIDWPAFSPLIGGTDYPQSLRTRSGITVIRDRLAGTDGIAEHGKIGIDELQQMLFANRNEAAELVLDDLLALCESTESRSLEAACRVLGNWNRRAELDSRGEHLFREWWRAARGIDGVWRVPFDPAHPVTTPRGLNTDDPTVRDALVAALEAAVATVQEAGFALDAPLSDMQHKTLPGGPVGLHGGMEFEGVLNKVEALGTHTLPPGGYEINFGSSYIQTVTFDDRGPVAEAILTYGQSTDSVSPYAFDQLALYANEQWLPLPFHREDVEAATIGTPLRLTVEPSTNP
ncbi:MAG TPA: acylase [Woeseiaceae bacterium]